MDFLVKCKECSRTIAKRAQNIKVVSNSQLAGFSCDQHPQAGELFGGHSKFQFCQCLITRIRCIYCHFICGYKVVQPCELCMSKPNNGHFWIFLNANGQPQGMINQSIFREQFYQYLSSKGVSSNDIEKLKAHNINHLNFLQNISDQQLESMGITQVKQLLN